MSTDKYELTSETVAFNGVTLYRIRALRSFSNVKVGDLGGFVKSLDNLSQKGNAWVSGNAMVFGNALIYGNAVVSGYARISGNVKVYGNAWVYGKAVVSDNARVFDNARVSDNARIFGNAMIYGDAEVYGNTNVYGNARIFDNASVSGKTWVHGDAKVYNKARISGNARVFDNAWVFGDACVFDNAMVYSNTCVSGDTKVNISKDSDNPDELPSPCFKVGDVVEITDKSNLLCGFKGIVKTIYYNPEDPDNQRYEIESKSFILNVPLASHKDLILILKSCPFCGNDAKVFDEPDADRNIVSCSLGHAPMRTIEGWQTRS